MKVMEHCGRCAGDDASAAQAPGHAPGMLDVRVDGGLPFALRTRVMPALRNGSLETAPFITMETA